jgi:prophage regulatory protein
MKFIKIEDVLQMTSLSRTTMYSLIRKGSFPKQIKLGNRISVWSEDKIISWMNDKINGGVQC